MQFALRTAGRAANLTAIERELVALDPAALLDLDASGGVVRIATAATWRELLDCLRTAGAVAGDEDLVQLPSECCGGCGG